MNEFAVSLHAQPLLTKEEAAFYNLLRLVAQDRYLLFAQVPVWCLVEVQAADRQARAAFLDKIALRRVDFVLVHPGTLTVEKVIELDDPSQASPQRQARNRLIEAVFKQAGITLVRLKAQEPYTVPTLAALLDLEPAEES